MKIKNLLFFLTAFIFIPVGSFIIFNSIILLISFVLWELPRRIFYFQGSGGRLILLMSLIIAVVLTYAENKYRKNKLNYKRKCQK